MNYYKNNTQHYAHHDELAAARYEKELWDIIMQKLQDSFDKQINLENMATREGMNERLEAFRNQKVKEIEAL